MTAVDEKNIIVVKELEPSDGHAELEKTAQKILNKVVLVKPLFICNQQILNLEGYDLPHHIDIIAAAIGKKYILIKYFKIRLKA